MSAVEVIAAFAAAWDAADDAERVALLAGCCQPDAVFAAPRGLVTGIDAMSASIGEFRRAFPLPMWRSVFRMVTASLRAS